MAPSEGNPVVLMLNVTATIDPSSPAAYCRTLPNPLGGGGPGLYVDFSMFCFQTPIIGFGPWTCVVWASSVQAIRARPETKAKQRFIDTSIKDATLREGSD